MKTITWEEYNRDIYELSNKIPRDKYRGVFGIPRGGLIVAVHLSHLLELPLSPYIYKDVLVVDDVSNTGRTLKDNLKYAEDVAILYKKNDTLWKPKYFVRTINDQIKLPCEV